MSSSKVRASAKVRKLLKITQAYGATEHEELAARFLAERLARRYNLDVDMAITRETVYSMYDAQVTGGSLGGGTAPPEFWGIPGRGIVLACIVVVVVAIIYTATCLFRDEGYVSKGPYPLPHTGCIVIPRINEMDSKHK